MRNLILKIYAPFQLKLLRAFLPTIFLAVCALGQGTGSVFVITQTRTNNDAGVVADYLAGEISEGIQDNFPCVDYSSPEDVKAVLDAARDRQLLTGDELTQEQLAEIGGAIGARYVVLVSATVLPNGQTIVTAKLLDTKTSTTIANESETAANAEAAFDNVDSVTKKIMQSFSKIFKNKCEPHWTGTISFTWKKEKKMNETKGVSGRSPEIDYTQTTSGSSREVIAIEASLQPMTQGFEGTKTMARVVHRMTEREDYGWKWTGMTRCRAPGQNPRLRQANASFSRFKEENGEKTAVLPVFVIIMSSTGQYEITVHYPAFTAKWHSETKDSPVGNCQEPEPTVMIFDGEETFDGNFKRVNGQIDPKNPDILTGEKITGDLESGQTTIKWNLRLVNPNKKKGLK